MPFVYRLQKILDFRIRRKEEQLLAVQRAQQQVTIAEQNIQRNNAEIQQLKVSQRTADYRMMESYDKYLHHLWEKDEQLKLIKQAAERKLQEEIMMLVEFEKAVKVLEKHKEKNREVYLNEEKAIELKNLSEVGIQRHFQSSRQGREDDEQEEQMLLKQLEQLERESINEY